MNPITLKFPYTISANNYWRSLVIGGQGRVVVSAEAKAYRRECQLIALASGIRKPISIAVILDVTLIPPEWVTYRLPGKLPQKRKAGPPQDLDNVLKIGIDALKGLVLVDDDQVKEIHARYGDRQESGALIVRISEFIPEPIGLFAEV